MIRRPYAKGHRRAPGEMNKLESRYAAHLETLKASGEIVWWRYEGLTFRLAKLCRYSPDFAVMLPDGTIELHETKGGFFADDAKVKVKTAAEMFPFRFFVVREIAKKRGGGWTKEAY